MLFFKQTKTTFKEKIPKRLNPVVLMILDGFGVSPITDGNAVRAALSPNLDYLQKNYPKVLLHASGNEVGLPYGEAGNSEVGHINIGSGRIVYQPLLRVSRGIAGDGLIRNEAMGKVEKHIKQHHGALHLIGLVSAGGVHSHIEHLFEILAWCKKRNIEKIFIHVVCDGRDSLPAVAQTFITDLEAKIAELNCNAKIASIAGRLYTMDRDKIWERTKLAYMAILGKGKKTQVIKTPILAAYAKNQSDEFVEPYTIVDKKDVPVGAVQNNDAILFFNIRPDRSRQIVSAFASPKFAPFKRVKISNLHIATLTEYDSKLPVSVVLPEENITNPLAQVISDHKLTQLHIAETQKYAHVTYFFNGGNERPYMGEKRILIPSLKVKHFNEKPAMSAEEITKQVLISLSEKKYDFIVLNFANPDMVGHTGDFEATKKAIEIIDTCVGSITAKTLELGGAVCITSDHGNSEEMFNFESNGPDTEHNIYPVPFMVISQALKKSKPGLSYKDMIAEPAGTLSDVAPTILDLMHIKKPKEMTGTSLIDSLM
ncbi:MAG: 2,3-bisphosphoglycerate-independent phosphoglycerate mutase [Patescibacteria group bacterium]